MTTEDDFQAVLDAHPDDWQTRLVFADWLQERDDPRADGYRALGVQRKRPFRADGSAEWYTNSYTWAPSDPPSNLPSDWFRKLPKQDRDFAASVPGRRVCPTRREAEDAAALAFAKLPAARRAELLATEEVTS